MKFVLTWYIACDLLQIMVILYLPCYEAAVGKQTSKQRLKYEAVICQVKRKMMLAAMTRAEELVKK